MTGAHRSHSRNLQSHHALVRLGSSSILATTGANTQSSTIIEIQKPADTQIILETNFYLTAAGYLSSSTWATQEASRDLL